MTTEVFIKKANLGITIDKCRLKYFIDVGMLLSFLSLAVTGIIKFPGLMQKFGISYIQLPMTQISFVHDWSGILLILLVAAHLILNYQFMITETKKFFSGEREAVNNLKDEDPEDKFFG